MSCTHHCKSPTSISLRGALPRLRLLRFELPPSVEVPGDVNLEYGAVRLVSKKFKILFDLLSPGCGYLRPDEIFRWREFGGLNLLPVLLLLLSHSTSASWYARQKHSAPADILLLSALSRFAALTFLYFGFGLSAVSPLSAASLSCLCSVLRAFVPIFPCLFLIGMVFLIARFRRGHFLLRLPSFFSLFL